jgi:predicted PurR-regulated permease PerM
MPHPASEPNEGAPITAHKDPPARDEKGLPGGDRLTGHILDLALRFAALGLLLYFALILVRPFLTIVIWSIVLAVSLYPLFEHIARWLGGRRRLAAIIVTLLTLLVVIGPVAWLVVSLIESVRVLADHFLSSDFSFPVPPESVKGWPVVGDKIYQYWELASTNVGSALAKIAPHLKSVGTSVLHIAGGAGAGVLKFLVSIFVAGFLFAPAPSLVEAARALARRLALRRGDEFVSLAGATIRNVAQGVVGVSALQAVLAGVGLVFAGVPGATLLMSAVLVCGIIQIGPTIVIVPVIIWSWMTMETTSALLFTAYMLPVNLLDNVLRPLVMSRGLKTPMPVILLGVIGGTLAYGISGLFLGPIALAVIWELLISWVEDAEAG